MQDSITWLHISDLHARKRTDWNSREIIDALVKDLKHFGEKEKLRPDFIFFTGDLAFGSVPGDKLEDQYVLVQKFLDSVLTAFDPPIPKRSLYIVPGNHDIDRNEITIGEKQWLRSSARVLGEILNPMQAEDKQWRSWMDRLFSYRKFLKAYGLSHLSPDNSHLIWSDVQNIGACRVGLCGFNSVWSAADEDDKGKLWAGLEFQIAKNLEEMGSVDLAFALIHHPGNWLVSQEDPTATRLLRQKFHVVLHGHEHTHWIEEADSGRLLISAGACYESSWMENGYNIGHINLSSGLGAIRLRQWDKVGRGWVQNNVAGVTQNGVWPIMGMSVAPASAETFNNTLQVPSLESQGSVANEGASPFYHYAVKFCKNTIEKFDYLELFGCDIPRELQKHQLSVAYVSLNLSPQDVDAAKPRVRQSSKGGLVADDVGADYIRQNASIQETIESLPPDAGRLVILGPAGAGKSTLLRWCAMYAAQKFLGELDAEFTGDVTALDSGLSGEKGQGQKAPRRLVWKETFRMTAGSRARWACGQVAWRPVHMSTGRC